MGLQTRDLCMLGLGVQGDVPGTPLQEVLPDGIHLRWAFTQSRGFPWFGYHLFRRPAVEKVDPVCIAERLKERQPGQSGVDTIPVSVGTLTSNVPFVFTDDFTPAGRVEADLRDRSFIRFDAATDEPVRQARVTIGFRTGGGADPTNCVSFTDETPGDVEPPIERLGARFSGFDRRGRPLRAERFLLRDGRVGWDPSFRGRVGIPCPADRVEIELVHASTAPTLTALDGNGTVVASQAMTDKGPEVIVLTAPGIVAVDIDAPSDECLVLRVCWHCGGGSGAGSGPAAVPVTASWHGTAVASTTVSGAAGDRVEVVLSADAIDQIVVAGGADAALVDLCVTPVRQGLADGWEKIDGWTYPLPLPVAQPDYRCPGAPGSAGDAEALALDRVVYGPAASWAGHPFATLHDQLTLLVEGGPPPGGMPMAERSADVAGSPAPTNGSPHVGQPRQRPLDLVLMGSLQPAIAQMLGLYWWDGSVTAGAAYDYLLLADHNGNLGRDAASALTWLATVADFTNVDGYICFGLRADSSAPLAPPTGARAFALPGDGATNSAGLTWDRRQIDPSIGTTGEGSGLEAGAPVLYHVWRADLGDMVTPPDPADVDFTALTKDSPLPVGRSRTQPPVAPQFPADWPRFGLHYVDRAGSDGWYAYRVSSVDLFGRHSRPGPSAAWWQWGPLPAPRPWYYTDPPADRLVHASRVRLLDKIPPPSPAGVEAFALDPADPTVTQDAGWQAWWNSLSGAERTSVIGLRVSWWWTADAQTQAPDTREFRIYHHPAPLDTVGGRVTATMPAAAPGIPATQSEVVTDLTFALPAGSFDGLPVRIGADSFTVVASQASAAGQPLRLRVRNVGPAQDIRPPARSGTRFSISLPSSHSLHRDYAQAASWNDRLLTAGYAQHVHVHANGDRRYEVFLPVAGSTERTGLPLVTSLDEPLAFGAIGVTAADDRQHSADHRGDLARYGNESAVGGPAIVLTVRRELPPLPSVPADSPTVYATPADYHNRSFHTYRWQPAARLRTLVFRALDDAVFQADWALRPRPVISAGSVQLFPSEATEPRWDQAKREQVSAELNGLNLLSPGDRDHPQSAVHKAAKADATAAYAALSNDALRVLAGLPGTKRVFVQLTPQPIEPDEAEPGAPDGLRWRRIGPDAAPGSLPAGQRAYVDTLDGRATNRYFYRCAHVDEVHNVGPLGLAGAAVTLPDVTPPVAPRIARVSAGDRAVTLAWASNREPDLAEYRVYRSFSREASGDIRLMELIHTEAVDAAVAPWDRPAAVEWTDEGVPGLRDIWYRLVAVDRMRADPRGGGGNVSASSPAMRARAYDQTPPDPPLLSTVEWVQVASDGSVHAWGTHGDQPPLDPSSAGFWVPAVRLAWDPPDDPGTRLMVQSMGASDNGFTSASGWLGAGTAGFVHRTTHTFEDRHYRLKAVSGAGNANQVFHPATLLPPALPTAPANPL